MYFNFNNYPFDYLLHKSKNRLEKKPNEPLFIKYHIAKINKYVKNLKSTYPDLTLDQLQEIFEKDYIEILDTIFKNGYILDHSMEYVSCIYLSNHKDIFEQLLEENLNDPESIPDEYSTNFNSNLKYFISELKKDYDDFLGSDVFKEPSLVELRGKLLDPTITNNEKVKLCNSISSQLSFHTKNHFKKFVDCVRNGESAYLKYELEDMNKDIKENLVDSISSIGNQLKKLGFLERYPVLQENAFNNLLGIKGFSHQMETQKNNTGLVQ